MPDVESQGGESQGQQNRTEGDDAENRAAEEQRRQEAEAVRQRKGDAKLPDTETLSDSPSDILLKDYIQQIKELVGEIQQGVTGDDLGHLSEIAKSLRDAISAGRVEIDDNARNVRDFLDHNLKQLHQRQQAEAAEMERQRDERQLDYQMPNIDKMLPKYKTVKGLLSAQITDRRTVASADLLQLLKEAEEAKDRILNDDFQKNDYAILFQVTKGIEETYRRSDEGDQGRLRTIMEGKIDRYVSKDEDVRYLSLVNRYFDKKLQDLTQEEQGAILGDIEVKASIAKAAVGGGWRELELEMRALKEQIEKRAEVGGLREWRGYKSFDAIEIAIRAEQIFKVPTIWENSPQTVSNIFRFIEDNELGSHEIGGYIQKALAVIEGIQDPSEKARDMREHLKRRLESFQAWHTMVITLRQKDMNPEPLISQFEIWNGRDEVTLEDFVDRFGEDSKGREFYVKTTKEGKRIRKRDKEGKEIEVDEERVNLFDISFRLYNETLQRERIKMNMIEEMTKFGIVGAEAHMGEIKDNVGYNDPNVTSDWKNQWDRDFTEMREYFREAIKEKIDHDLKVARNKGLGDEIKRLEKMKADANRSVDNVWARRDSSGTGIESFTKELIQEWHRKRTLHGAFGTIGRDDLTDLIGEDDLVKVLKDEYSRRNDGEAMPVGREELKKALLTEAKRTFEGRGFLEVRRMALQIKMIEELKASNLVVNRDTGEMPRIDPATGREIKPELVDVNYPELQDTGFFNSVDFNAYNFTWMMMWSNYDNIRVYSRDNVYAAENGGKLKDDFVDIVHHKNTNIFNGRAIDHTWEFYHDTVENRGRARDNDVNRIWKQALPGKHHYIFPQNTLMVRWRSSFWSDEQKKEVERRVDDLCKNYNFDNPKYHKDFRSWMESVAVMDMVENGQFNLAGKNFSELAKSKAIGKFEMIDVFVDRKKHLEYTGTKLFQSYLANPSAETFVNINAKEQNFYSTRDARLFPWMTLALRSHWEVVHNHNRRLFDDDNVFSASMESMVKNLVQTGYVEKEQGTDFERQKLGMTPKNVPAAIRPTVEAVLGNVLVRRIRQIFGDGYKKYWQEEKMSIGLFFLFYWWWIPVSNIAKGIPATLK